MLFRRIKCLICDLGLVYLFLYCFGYINPWKTPLLCTYFCFVGLYFLVSFFVIKKSIFQYLFAIKIEQRHLAYTLFKVLFLSVIPFWHTFRLEFFGLRSAIIMLFVLNATSYLIKKKTIWELCAKTKLILFKREKYHKQISKIITFIVSVLLIITSIQYVVLLTKKNPQNISKVINFLQSSFTPFPVSQVQKYQYINDIKKYKQDPFEYLMQLFKNHDIVVLCERMHPEYTQWQFFSQIIFNDNFALKIGNVATEFGNINNQRQLDTLLNNSFKSEKDRKKAFAALIRENGGMWPLWNNTNIYDFALNMSKFNEKQDEKHTINWFFCDVESDWKNTNNRQDWEDKNFKNYNRDSIMAVNIMSVFDNLKNNKLLVILNTRHAYKEKRGFEFATADYLNQYYGEKVAFVWLNSVARKTSIDEIFQPYQMGVLDAAAMQIKDSIWAISFSNSILGNDRFELLPHVDKWNLKMKDLFDGMIYCMHPSQHYKKEGYEYILSDFADTLLKRNKIVYGEENGETLTTEMINIYKSGETYTYIIPYFLFFNVIFYIIHYLILFYLLAHLISILKKKAI